jgi:hypothetical protein
MKATLVLTCGLLLATSSLTSAQDTTYVQQNFTKQEVRIPMRDGVKLFTAIYAPKATGQKYPILLNRTPYSVAPYGEGKYKTLVGPSEPLMRDGYIVVYQDVRGRLMSEGEFVNMTPHQPNKRGRQDIDESTDTYDTIEWLIKNVANHSGRVGMWGISYPGYYTAAGMIEAHPALKAASPQAPIADWFTGDDFHRNGALWLPHFFNFIAAFGRPRPAPTTQGFSRFSHPTPDGYEFFLNRMKVLKNANPLFLHDSIAFWNDVIQHPNYDEFWKVRNLRPHLRNIKPAVMTVGGLFDAENIYGALQVYQAVEQQSPRTNNIFVYGPWFHGGWARSTGEALGNVRFGSATSEFYRDSIEFPFFSCHLKDRCERKLPEAYVFETGSNVWQTYDTWPPKSARAASIYLRENGKISFDAPSNNDARFDEYRSDPARPVPFIDYINIGMPREYMTDDQRHAARRPDVLAYQTEPLDQDLTLVGPLEADLWVSTSGTDSDWVVKLIDVYPDSMPNLAGLPPGVMMAGYQQLVRGEVMRGRFRNSFERPEAFVPDRPTNVKWWLNDVSHTFKRGHRIMVQIQSTWFPLMDRNPQKFVASIYDANESDFQAATQRVYRSVGMPSRIGVHRTMFQNPE